MSKNQKHIEFRRLLLETLDRRELLAADASVAFETVDSSTLIGETVDLQFAFSNSNSDNSEVGFGPYVDLVIPASGSDGDDGLRYVEGSASLLDNTLQETVLTVGSTGVVEHPFALDAEGNPLSVEASPGDQLVVITLPIGSYVGDQPALHVDFQVDIDSNADVGDVHTIQATAGYRFGQDALDNPSSDPMLRGESVELGITPEVVVVNVEYDGPENETAVGPNFEQSYTVTIDVADGVVLRDLDTRGLLDNNQSFLGLSTDDSWDSISQPLAGLSNDALVQLLRGEIEGQAGVDAEFKLSFFVADSDADGDATVSAITGQHVISEFHVSTHAKWQPLDSRDQGEELSTFSSELSLAHELQDQAVAIQSSIRIKDDNAANGLSPTDILEYMLDFQIADHVIVDGLTVTSTVPDGQDFLGMGEARLTFYGIGDQPLISVPFASHSSGQMNPAPGGAADLVFDIASELKARNLSDIVYGGETDDGLGRAVYGRVTFLAEVREDFVRNIPSNDASVDEGDIFLSSASITGHMIDPATGEKTQNRALDDSHVELQVPRGALSTEIYAINGSTNFDEPAVKAGDEVTLRIRRTVHSSDVESLVISDYLPMPVFELESIQFASGGGLQLGTFQLGPNDTFHELFGGQADVSYDVSRNLLQFDFGSFDSTQNETTEIDLLITVGVADQPFADGLWLTSQANSQQGTTNNGTFSASALADVQYTRPVIEISKGGVSSDNPAANFSGPVGPSGISFSSPGSQDSFSGTFDHTTYSQRPVDANVTGVDAGDLVRIAVIAENVGLSEDGAFELTLRDSLPAGYSIPSSGLNLRVQDGAGNLLQFDALNSGDTVALFGDGIRIADNIADVTASDGSNFVIITYDLEVSDAAEIGASSTATAEVVHYAAVAGGTNYVTSQVADDVTMTISLPSVTHKRISTDQDHTDGKFVVIGENVTYRTEVNLPEASTTGSQLRIDLPRGLAIDAIQSITWSDGVSFSVSESDVLTSARIEDIGKKDRDEGRVLIIDLGDMVNLNRDNTTAEKITVEYSATVVNSTNNLDGKGRRAKATFSHAVGSSSSKAASVKIVEPSVALERSFSSETGDAGDRVTVSVELVHDGDSPDAFDLQFAETLPDDWQMVDGTLQVDGAASSDLTVSGNTITGSFAQLSGGNTLTITYDIILDERVTAGEALAATAELQWSSLPGEPGQISSNNSLAFERTGDTSDVGDSANNYAVQSTGVITVDAPTVDLELVETSADHTSGTALTIGERAFYEITVTVPEGQHSLDINTLVPNGDDVLSIESFELIHLGDNLSLTGTTVPSLSGVEGESNGRSVNLGTVTNNFDNADDANDQIVFRLEVLMLDTDANAEGDLPSIDSTVNFDHGAVETSESLETVEAGLQLSMDASQTQVDATDTVQVKVGLSHNPAFGSDPQSIRFRAFSGSEALSLVTGSAQVTGGNLTVVAPIEIDGNNMNSVSGASVYARRVGPDGTVVEGAELVNDNGRIGVVGTAEAGVLNQIGLNAENGIAEQVVMEFDEPFSAGSFTFSRLFKNEGNNRGGSGHEQGSWQAYSNGVLIASDVFVATEGSHRGTVTIALPDGATADMLTFTPTEYSGGQQGSTEDSSDFFIDAVTLTRPEEFIVTIDQLKPGESIELTYDVLVEDYADPGDLLTLLGEAEWTSLEDGAGRSYNADVSTELQVNSAGISGWAFVDENQDGRRGSLDVGLSGNVITLTGVDHLGNEVGRETTVSAGGFYEFLGLRPGKYEVEQSHSDEFADGQDYLGSFGGNALNDRFESIVIESGTNEIGTNYNFTESPLTWITGTVFMDQNENGKLGADEDGIAGVTVYLVGETDQGVTVERRVQTNNRGYFVFGSLPSGTYSLKQEHPEGYFDAAEQVGSQGGEASNDAFTGIRVAAGKPGEYYNFGEYEASSIEGQVYIDYDRDLVRDRKDGLINGVDVFLKGINDLGEEISMETVTDVDGFYRFEGLRPGTYKVASVSIDGLDQGVSNVGLFLGASNAASENGTPLDYGFEGIQMPAGGDGQAYDIGHIDPLYEASDLVEGFDKRHVFKGTGEDDTFKLLFTSDYAIISVNGDEYVIDGDERVSVHVLGSFGQDSIFITGSENKEAVNIRDTSANVTGTWFSSLVYGMENINFVGGGNEDLVRFYDTAGDNQFVASPFEATFAGEGFKHHVDGIHRIYAFATSGGSDTAELSGSTRRDNFVATPDHAKLYDGDYYLWAEGFDKVSAKANDASDRAYIFGSETGENNLTASEHSALLSGDSYKIAADGFKYVLASAGTGDNDTADLKGSSHDDTLNSRPTKSTFDVNHTRIIAKGFETVDADAGGGGNDQAFMRDSHFDDTFKADANSASLLNSVSQVTASGFDEVTALAEAGGNDVAYVAGGEGKDTFKAWSDHFRMEGTGYQIAGAGFTQVEGYANSEDDKAYLYDSVNNDILEMGTDYARMTGERFDNQATGFNKVVAEATSGGFDRAVYHDSDARSTVRFNGEKLTVFGEGFSDNAIGFSAVDVFYDVLNGNDRVELSGDLDVEMIVDEISEVYRLSMAAGDDGVADTLNDRVSNIPVREV